MSGYIEIDEFASEADIPTPSSGDKTIAMLSEGMVLKDNAGDVYRFLGYKRYTAQTTDATPTNVSDAEVLVSEGQVVFVKAIVQARIADLSAALVAELTVGARRATGGNVTLLDTVDAVIFTDSTATVTLVADTTAQAVDVQITGVAAETWNWEILLFGRTF